MPDRARSTLRGMGHERHFPDGDEFVWLVETGDLNRVWGRWWPAPGDQPNGGRAPCETPGAAAATARQALADWLAATVAAGVIDTEDLWLRVSVWRLGRVIDGGLVRTGPDEVRDLTIYGSWLYAQSVAPDAVEVRTPLQVAFAADELRAGPAEDLRARLRADADTMAAGGLDSPERAGRSAAVAVER
jgi:hypothetical protein